MQLFDYDFCVTCEFFREKEGKGREGKFSNYPVQRKTWKRC